VRFSHEAFGTAIDEHPVGRRFPRPTARPSLQAGGYELLSMATPRGGCPRRFADLVDPAWGGGDTPQLGLHVVTFSDATLVSLAWPHTMTDGLGRQALMRNWARVLAGREDEVQPLGGFQDDPLLEVVDAPAAEDEEPLAIRNRLLGRWGKLLFALHLLYARFWAEPDCEQRTIFLPREKAEELQRQATAELAAEAVITADSKDAPQPAPPPPPFISEGDVLTAWCTKLACGDQPASRPVSIINTFELRSRLRGVFDPAVAYVQNLVIGGWVLLTVGEALGLSLGALALRMRTALAAQTTEAQTRAAVREIVRSNAAGEGGLLAGEPAALLLPFSNWSKAKFFEVVDFGPAVVRAGKSEKEKLNKPGRPVYFHAAGLSPNPMLRNVFNISGKDAMGNYWINATLTTGKWAHVRDVLSTM